MILLTSGSDYHHIKIMSDRKDTRFLILNQNLLFFKYRIIYSIPNKVSEDSALIINNGPDSYHYINDKLRFCYPNGIG